MSNQNPKLEQLAALKNQNAPFQSLAKEQQRNLERIQSQLGSIQPEIVHLSQAASSQADLLSRVSEFLCDLRGNIKSTPDYELVHDLTNSLYSVLHGMAAQLKNIDTTLGEIQSNLPDFRGERMTRFWLEQEQQKQEQGGEA